MLDESKCFAYGRELNRYYELVDMQVERVVPQFVVVGDQSSGKTTILCRMAGIPLGFTAAGTGTRRPFEYTLLHDPEQTEPLITVDAEEVSEMALLAKLTKVNGTERDGFRNEAVSVKIVWKEISQNMMIVDMPGMKDGDTGPEDMVLERLKHSNVIPVVVLEARDMGTAHYVYKVLERAQPPRDASNIIAIVNKCDSKMEGSGDWVDQACFKEWWQGAMAKRFKAIFCVGWPGCTSRGTSDPQQQKRQLLESTGAEETLIQKFLSQVDTDLRTQVTPSMGLSKFKQTLNSIQAGRLRELIDTSGTMMLQDYARWKQEMCDLEEQCPKDAVKKVSSLMHNWSKKVEQFLDAKFNVNQYKASSSTVDEDLRWVCEEASVFLPSLPEREEFEPLKTLELLGAFEYTLQQRPSNEGFDSGTSSLYEENESATQGWAAALQPWIPSFSIGLFGKAAFERDIVVVLQLALFRIFEHILTHFNETFCMNIFPSSSEDAGNKVVLEFTSLVCHDTLHPLADVLTMLVKRHLEGCLKAPFKRFEGCEKLKGLGLVEEFEAAACCFGQKLTAEFNLHLHRRLDEQCFRLEGRCRSTEEGEALASNTAGRNPTKTLKEEDYSFEGKAKSFLLMSLETLESSGSLFEPAAELYRSMLDSLDDRSAAPAKDPQAPPRTVQRQGGSSGGRFFRAQDADSTASTISDLPSPPVQVDRHLRGFLSDLKERFQLIPSTTWGGLDLRILQRHTFFELLHQVMAFRNMLEKRVEWIKSEVKKRLAYEVAWAVGRGAVKKVEREHRKKLKHVKQVVQVLQNARVLRKQILGTGDSDSDDDSDA